jgi:hypothetical protein
VVVWLLAALGLLGAGWALVSIRRLSRKLDALTQSYWELRYDYTRLRSQVARLDPGEATEAEPAAAPGGAPSVSFVPLSSIRRKDQ